MDVPISVSTVDTEQLLAVGATDIVGLTALVPGLKMNTTGTTTIPAIRGITTQVTEPGIDANVATYVDGLYQPAMAANDIDLPDVERIEVLKGPQGTLYGRNATGGVIQVFTKDPGYDTSGTASLGWARFNDFTAKGFLTAPLVDGVAAASISAFHEKSDSYRATAASGSITVCHSAAVRRCLFRPPGGRPPVAPTTADCAFRRMPLPSLSR